jgi:hypothetical protein
MTASRIQALESLGFEWDRLGATWEDHLSELADYHIVHGNCDVPQRYSENTKLGFWVANQRVNYKMHREGKKSPMTASRIQALESLGFEWDCQGTAWKDRLSELVGYHKIHGHCNVPQRYSENTKLGIWVVRQRINYMLHREGKKSTMTASRIQALESLGFEWDCQGAAWKDRFSELVGYHKIHGHFSFTRCNSENTKLAKWVTNQRVNYRLHREGKKSPMTALRIQALESLGFEWDCQGTAWKDRFSELVGYHKIHGHCIVPKCYSENLQLGDWVGRQRENYMLHREGKKSTMTASRIQALESLGFEWDCQGAAWKDRFSELVGYHKIHGHCNVPSRYSENTKLGIWVVRQRVIYRLHREGKKSPMTALRIQALESLDFEWDSRGDVWEDRFSELVGYHKIHGHCNVPSRYSENTKLGFWVGTQRRHIKLHRGGKKSHMTALRIQALESLGF